MFLLTRPPYLRWVAAAALVGGALAWEVSSSATAQVAFASSAISRGDVIDAAAVVWRNVPSGTLAAIDPIGATAIVEIRQGDPISASVVTRGVGTPDGWWSIPADVPRGAVRGSTVRIVFADGFGITGVVVEPSTEDAFGIPAPGLIAVPADAADLVALAASSNELVMLFEP